MKLKIGLVLCLLAFISAIHARTVVDPYEIEGIQNRIVSGRPASVGQFPWQVIIKKNEMDDIHCGGAIFSAVWVLTAGHCTYGQTSLYLTFGTIFLEDPKALSMTVSSKNFYIHPNYNNDNLNNDVSLIALPTPLPTNANIRPIRLVSAAEASETFQGTTATIAGFGLMDDEYLEFSQILEYANVEIIDNNRCVQVFGNDVVISSTICAIGANGSNQSICSGDSGGPLIARDDNGDYMQIGINSFVAQDRCTEGKPSGYARLTSFLKFIEATTGIVQN